MLKKCLWNNPTALREQSEKLRKEGYDQAAQGCLDRASKVEHLLSRLGNPPRNTRPFEEPVDLR